LDEGTREGPFIASRGVRVSIFEPGEERVFVDEEECAGSRVVRWRNGSAPIGTLVFCHGFMAQPMDSSRLLSQVATHGIDVIAPSGMRGDSTRSPDGERSETRWLIWSQ
jgi:hypothetical protein